MAPQPQHRNTVLISAENTASAAAALPGNTLTDTTYRLKLALRQAIQSSPTPRPSLESIRGDTAPSTLHTGGSDVVASEVLCARLFNTPLPQDIPQAVTWLLEAIKQCCHVSQVVLFLYDDERDQYLCMNDELPGADGITYKEPRKLSQLSDDTLRQFLETDAFIHGHLLHGTELLGLVAIAQKTDGTPLDNEDELRLDIIGPYLAATLVTYRQLKANLLLGNVQRTVLAISSQLIKAVDQENVLSIALQAFGQQLGFEICQYIQRVPHTENGEVLLEFSNSTIQSFMHAGLASKRKRIGQFLTLLGLFKSVARQQPYLLLPGNTLGDDTLTERFQLPLSSNNADSPSVYSALILPVFDPASGRIRGTLNLYRLRNVPIEQATLEMAQEMIGLVSLALSRVMVLEMALEMASTDELTGLTNRRGFYDRFEAEIERARRIGSPLCVAMLDVDFFKAINDTHGHLNGDAVLHQLGQTIKHQLRKSDLVCRFGGEEFAILLPDTRFEDAMELLERIRGQVAAQPMPIQTENSQNSLEIPVTVSAGLARVALPEPQAGEKPPKLTVRPHALISNALEQADRQLYLAKQHGRNRVCAVCE